MTPSSAYLNDQLARIGLCAQAQVWIAYSGGMDSHVLLRLAVDSGLNAAGRLRAVHIHHGLDPAADIWAEHCQTICQGLGVELQVHRVVIDGTGSLENRARQARYRVFESLVGEGDLLLQGHHADDQAETLLLRLMRGSGVRGLAAIPAERMLGQGRLLRPLLSCSRIQLQAYAEQQRLCWVDDPSNVDTVHDRNYLRATILPRLVERWPTAVASLNRSADNSADAQRLIQDLAAIDIKSCLNAGAMAGDGLVVAALSRLPDHRRSNVLRYWLHQQAQLLPDEHSLQQLWHQLANARHDAQPLLRLGRWQLRRFDGVIYLLVDAELPAADVEREWQLAADGSGQLSFAGGILQAVATPGEGLLLPRSGCLQVRLRQGGERIRLPGREGSRSLKKLLQQHRMPPWLRSQLPLIYLDDTLVAIAGLWVAEGYQALPEQVGIRLSWRPMSAVREGEF